MVWNVLDRFGPIGFMATVLILSQAYGRLVQRRRARVEAQRLRCALTLGLRGLRVLYEENLKLLAAGEVRLISGRNQLGLFRPQLNRLTMLEQTEIEAVLAACIEAERAETAMAVAGRSAGAAIFTLPDTSKDLDALESALTRVCLLVAAAEASMAPVAVAREEPEEHTPIEAHVESMPTSSEAPVAVH